MARDADHSKNRKRYGQLPEPSERANVYWGVKEPNLAGISKAEHTALLISQPEFKEIIGRELETIDNRNRTGYGNKMGRPSKWSALQLESILIYRRVAGLSTIKKTLVYLRADAEARLLLGLGGQLPSLATLTRYMRQHSDEGKRAELHLELDRRLRERVCQLPSFDEEARILGMDGSQHGTRYTAPIPERNDDGELTGKIVNEKDITAETAGYVGGNHAKSGKGWQLLGLFTEHGTPVAWDISPLHEGETTAAERVLSSYEDEVLPHRSRENVSVCTADGGFNSNNLRNQLQNFGVVPNIHKASHKTVADTEDGQTENASERERTWYPFEHPSKPHYSNWQANGHGEIRCSCDEGTLKSEYPLRGKGVVPVTKGACSTCGNATFTSGQWRRSSNRKRWVRCYRGDEADPTIGNPLTFNNILSAEYGKDRFGFGESIHATIERRFGLLKDKSWLRNITEVKTEFAIAFSAVSVLLLERDARRQQRENVAPLPPQPRAGDNTELPAAPLPLAA
jgi:PAS domain-containing protein